MYWTTRSPTFRLGDWVRGIELLFWAKAKAGYGATLTVFSFFLQNPTHSFINRPSQTAYRRNGIHELVLGPKLSIGDLGLPQIPVETEF